MFKIGFSDLYWIVSKQYDKDNKLEFQNYNPKGFNFELNNLMLPNQSSKFCHRNGRDRLSIQRRFI